MTDLPSRELGLSEGFTTCFAALDQGSERRVSPHMFLDAFRVGKDGNADDTSIGILQVKHGDAHVHFAFPQK